MPNGYLSYLLAFWLDAADANLNASQWDVIRRLSFKFIRVVWNIISIIILTIGALVDPGGIIFIYAV